MELRTEIRNGACEVAVDGELTIYHANDFRREFEEVIRKVATITLDLGKVSEIDTAGFQLLMQAQTACREHDKELNIVSLSPAIKEVMDIFGLVGYFDKIDIIASN